MPPVLTFLFLLLYSDPALLSAQDREYEQEAEPGQPATEVVAGRGHLRSPDMPFPTPGRDLLNRGVWQGYTNLGRDPYESFTVSTKAFEVYDRMGERLMRGYPLVSWEESRPDGEGVPTWRGAGSPFCRSHPAAAPIRP